jgi:L-arabinose isomerase
MHRRHHLDAHLLAGKGVDRGLDALRKPLLHLHTQANLALPWAEIDMDFMNLNQAAHGDREFGYIETRLRLRRKTVVGPRQRPGRPRQDRPWAGPPSGWHASQICASSASATTCATSPSPRATRSRPSSASGPRSTPTASTTSSRSSTALPSPRSTLVAQYENSLRPSRPRAGRAARKHDSLRYAARIEAGLRTFLEDGGFTAFTTNFEDLGGLRQLPGIAVQRLMADGYGFGAEGDWKTSVLLRALKVMAGDRPGGTSFMEDYTYHLGPASRRSSVPTCSRSAPASRASRVARSTRSGSATGRTPSARLRRQARPLASSSGLVDLGDRFRLVANDIEIVPPDAPLCPGCLWRAPCGSPAPSLSRPPKPG